MSLFDEQNFAEITHPDYPGERLIACRNPALADLRARKRTELLAATETALAPILAAVSRRAADRRRQDRAAGRARSWAGTRWPNTSSSTITDTTLTDHPEPAQHRHRSSSRRHLRAAHHRHPRRTGHRRRSSAPTRTSPTWRRDFRSPQGHRHRPTPRPPPPRTPRQSPRVPLLPRRAPHLAPPQSIRPAHLHRRTPTQRDDPVAPAQTAKPRTTKTTRKPPPTRLPLRTYQGLLAHLATLTRNDLQYGSNGPVIPTLAEPTPVQRRAFELLGAPIPPTLT